MRLGINRERYVVRDEYPASNGREVPPLSGTSRFQAQTLPGRLAL
jgi:hypothetical protein